MNEDHNVNEYHSQWYMYVICHDKQIIRYSICERQSGIIDRRLLIFDLLPEGEPIKFETVLVIYDVEFVWFAFIICHLTMNWQIGGN